MPASFSVFLRSGPVLAGILLLSIGLGNLTVGSTKFVQYRDIVRNAPLSAPRDPAALFPTATEDEQQFAVARAKVGYYQVMVTAGRFLTALGLVLVASGVLYTRHHLLRTR
jgi:hypothetical protein